MTPKIDIMDLGRKQVDLFLSNNVTYCEILVTCSCPRHILLMAYQRLVQLRKITPIEDMLQEQKKIAWETAKDIAKGRLRKIELVEVVQALLTIEYFLSL